MIIIPKEVKPTLNTLIHYYRHQREVTDTRYIPKNFIIDSDGEKICDVSTLSKLENNRICCLDDIYFSLVENLNMKLSLHPDVDQFLHSLNENILKNAERNYSKKIMHFIDETKTLVGKHKDSIIYNEYFEIYDVIYMYYKDLSFDKQLIDKYLELYDLVDDFLKPVFITIAYHYYSRVNVNSEVSLDIITRSLDLPVDSIIKRYLINVYYIRTNQLLLVKKKLEQMAHYCKEDDNPFYLVKSYNLLACLFATSEPKKSLHYLNLYMDSFDHENDTKENLLLGYRNIAHIAFSIQDYKKVIEIYNNNLYRDNDFINIFFMFLIFSIKKTSNNTKEIQRIIIFVKTRLNGSLAFHKSLVDFYYSVYFSKSFDEILVYIHKILKAKDNFINQELLKSIILDEIREVCNKYKAYSTYKKVMKILQ